jgi:hypothetical protein
MEDQYCATQKVGWATPGPNNYLTIILSASLDNSEPYPAPCSYLA